MTLSREWGGDGLGLLFDVATVSIACRETTYQVICEPGSYFPCGSRSRVGNPRFESDEIRIKGGLKVRNRFIGSIATVMTVLALSPVGPARAAQQSETPTIQAAKPTPDFSGVWLVQKFQAKIFPSGDPPFQPWAATKFKAAKMETNDPNLGCLPHGLPRVMYVPLPMEIFHVPGRVIILQEALHQVRQIFLTREHPKDLDPTYSGDSIGKWEGDTLVVDTVGFNDKTWLDHVGLPHSDALHVVERLRRVDHDTLEDDFTIDDAKAYTKPWTARQVYKLKPGWEIREYVCEENNKYTYQEK
jgi:hypothetical protein